MERKDGERRHVGRPAKRIKRAITPKVPGLYPGSNNRLGKTGSPDKMESIVLLSYSRKPGGGYLAQQRFIDLVIASTKEDEFVTSSWMKVGV